jgi:hypothetical protein
MGIEVVFGLMVIARLIYDCRGKCQLKSRSCVVRSKMFLKTFADFGYPLWRNFTSLLNRFLLCKDQNKIAFDQSLCVQSAGTVQIDLIGFFARVSGLTD